MFFRFITHLVFVGVFLFGSTFSCTAFTDKEEGHGHYDEIVQEKTHDDCCPKDGHKKQIEGKNIVQTLQKKGFGIESFVPKSHEVFCNNNIKIRSKTLHYHNPPYDRQRLFFTDTIKLLL